MQSPKVTRHFAENGLRAEPGTPEDFETLVRGERSRVGAIVRSAGITAD
jgi:tripartite-type tricarboxylate transporter receptor subunit TctC